MKSHLVAIATLLIFAFCPPDKLLADKPNLIFILSDDIAQGDIGAYGQQLIKTPNLDRLCQEGTRYLSTHWGYVRIGR